jgi:hypothetical protein
MENDTNTEHAELSQDIGAGEVTEAAESSQDSHAQDEAPEDYQGKLNATNRFLKKEGYEWKDGKWQRPEASSEQKPAQQQGQQQEFGYGEKAYLNSLGITGTEAHDLIFGIARRTGDSIEEIAQSEYVKGKLKAFKTQEATPSGTNRTHSSARDTVGYWIEKGELPPADQVELRRKVVNEKIKRASSGSRFGNTDVEIR